MKLSDMRAVLEAKGIQLTKSLGQNFLHDRHQLDRILVQAAVAPGERVLEIGPGLGPLTERLLEAGAHVRAIEKDRRLVDVLRERFGAAPHFELYHDDALDWLRHEARAWSGWKVVSNLPYCVASPILVELALASEPPDRMVVTLQWEVAQRLAAAAGSEPYGVLSLLVQLHFQPQDMFRIPPGCFFPAPDVASACVKLVRRGTPLLDAAGQPAFVRLVKLAFSQRRKMMIKLLRAAWRESVLLEAFGRLGLAREVRAERVTLEQFVALAEQLATPGGKTA